MKQKMSKNDIRNEFDTVVFVPYCGLDSLLVFDDPIGYNCGVYGWNYDVYDLGNRCAIVTGYRVPNTIADIQMDHTKMKDYNAWAQAILRNEGVNYDTAKRQIEALKRSLIEKDGFGPWDE